MTIAKYAAVILPVLLSAMLAGATWGNYPVSGDWGIASRAGDLLVAGRLDVYAVMPKAQMGPLALALASVLPRVVYVAIIIALLPVIMLLGTRNRPLETWSDLAWLWGVGLILTWPWTALAMQAHADDALVLLGASMMVAALGDDEDHNYLLVLGFILAISAKPTAALLVPLLLLRGRTMPALISLVGTALIWAPFFLAGPAAFLSAGKGTAAVLPSSLQALLGTEINAGYPSWVRPVQLVGCLLLVWRLARRMSPEVALLVAFTFRTLLEPGAWNYYASSVAVCAFLCEARFMRLPVASGPALMAFVATFPIPVSPLAGLLRLVALTLVLMGTVYLWARHQRDGTAPAATTTRPVKEPSVA